MQDEPKPRAIGDHRPDYALFVAGVRGAQTASPTARAQSTIANKDAAAAPDPFKTSPAPTPQDGSYRGFSEVTNGKRS